MSLPFQSGSDAGYPHRRSKAVDIRISMSHNDNLIFAGNDLLQRMGFYPRLYSRILLYLLALAP